MKRSLITLLSIGSIMISQVALADKINNAKVHFNSIATADIDKVMGQYRSDAQLNWIGGPLDGSYNNEQALRTVWTKFTGVLGSMSVDVKDIKESHNPKGSTITADVLFKGKKTIPVHYVLVYRDDKIQSEIWQIAPSIKKSY